MSWCKTHPRYRAKSTPKGLCGACWKLYFLKNPENWRNSLGFRTALKIVRRHVDNVGKP
jgi:hypothetical protein